METRMPETKNRPRPSVHVADPVESQPDGRSRLVTPGTAAARLTPKRIALLLLGLVALGVAITMLTLGSRGKGDRPQWRMGKVVRADIHATVTATGTLQPVVTSPVGAQVSGIVWKLHADFNSHVQAGQVLVELEPALFENAVQQAEANVRSARAAVAKNRAQLADAVRIRDRARKLAGNSFLPQADADTAQSAVESGQAAVEGAEAQVLQARAQLDRARLDLAHSVVHSPVTGTVISRNVDVGQAVASSFTAPTLFTIAEDLAKMALHANIDEADIGQLHVGQPASFTVDTFRGRRFQASVAQIRNASQTLSNVVTYDVVMQVDNGDLQLRPGMTANVTIVCASKEKVLAVPRAALRFRPPSEPPQKGAADRGSVYVAGVEQPRRVPVTVGLSDGSLTEVEGIAEGEEVIVDALRSKDPAASANAGSGRGY
jgi:HlyD family secretion protein